MSNVHHPSDVFTPAHKHTHIYDDKIAAIFNLILLYKNYCSLLRISLKVVLTGPFNNSVFVQIMASHRTGDKPLLFDDGMKYWRTSVDRSVLMG